MRKLIVVTLLAMLMIPAWAEQKAVHFKKLQEFLPTAELQGFTRSKPEGSSAMMAGFSSSTAEVRYQQPAKSDTTEESLIGITITDVGPMGSVAYQAMFAVDFENETEDGYEKTVKFGKFKAIEKMNKADKSFELTMIIGTQYVVTLRGQNLDDNKLVKQLAGKMNLDKLSQLKEE